MAILGVPEEEFKYYLAEFKKARYFAAVKAGGECLDSGLAKSLAMLHSLGLLPIVVHGGGMQIDGALKQRGIEPVKIKGKRVTDEKTLEVVVSTLKTVNRDFAAEINRIRDCAKGLNGVFYVDRIDPVYGYVGNVTGMDRPAIDKCLDKGLIPVISSLGVDSQGQDFNLNADSAYRFLVSGLKPKKVIFLASNVDGVYRGEEFVFEISSDGLQELIDAGFVTGGMELKSKEAKALAELGFDVQITTPENLIIELFSRKGHGTYVRGKR